MMRGSDMHENKTEEDSQFTIFNSELFFCT